MTHEIYSRKVNTNRLFPGNDLLIRGYPGVYSKLYRYIARDWDIK
jgi:hypothetical protein